MGTPAKLSTEQQKRIFAQLEIPFDPSEISWRVVKTANAGRRGVILPFADPRAYQDRLNQLFTPSGWSRDAAITTVPSLCRVEDGKSMVTSKVLVAVAVTIHRLGSHTGTGEEWADRDNALTGADAQAFKRACSYFGLGRYLYYFRDTWVSLDRKGRPLAIPILPSWALPPGVIPLSNSRNYSREARSPIDPLLSERIETFRDLLGDGIYAEILRREGECRDIRSILNAERQQKVERWMEAADRGMQKVRYLADAVGEAQFIAVVRRLKINSITTIPNLETLKRLVEALETCSRQQAA
jgi:hypothetical protein